MNEMQLSQQVAEHICAVGRANGRQFRSGEYVACLTGKLTWQPNWNSL
jgi:hypothetical protein